MKVVGQSIDLLDIFKTMKNILYVIFFLGLFGLAACSSGSSTGGTTQPTDRDEPSGLVMRLPAVNLFQLQVHIYEYWPQRMYAGRGYSFEAIIDRDGKVFGPVTTEYAQTDLRLAAIQFCHLSGGGLSRFFNYSDGSSGLAEHRIYFNCT